MFSYIKRSRKYAENINYKKDTLFRYQGRNIDGADMNENIYFFSFKTKKIYCILSYDIYFRAKGHYKTNNYLYFMALYVNALFGMEFQAYRTYCCIESLLLQNFVDGQHEYVTDKNKLRTVAHNHIRDQIKMIKYKEEFGFLE